MGKQALVIRLSPSLPLSLILLWHITELEFIISLIALVFVAFRWDFFFRHCIIRFYPDDKAQRLRLERTTHVALKPSTNTHTHDSNNKNSI